MTAMLARMQDITTNKKLTHACILVCECSKRDELSKQLISEMMGADSEGKRKINAEIHPDVIYVKRPFDDKGKERREVYVAQIRDICTDTAVLPNEDSFKIYCIFDGEFMNVQAQNALLKVLEEPPKHVKFLLCTDNADSFLETIRSRCTEIFAKTEIKKITPNEDVINLSKIISKQNRLSLLKFCIEKEGFSIKEAEEFFEHLQEVLCEELTGNSEIFKISSIKLMDVFNLTEKCLVMVRSNVSVKHVLGLFAVSAINIE